MLTCRAEVSAINRSNCPRIEFILSSAAEMLRKPCTNIPHLDNKSSASVKDWRMSPQGIMGPLDQSSPSSGNNCQLSSTLTVPNFVTFQQQVHEISAVEIFCLQKSGPNVTKIAPMPLTVPNFIALGQTMYEKSVTKFFYTLQYFGTSEDTKVKVYQSWLA